jgi:hypothetical protein
VDERIAVNRSKNHFEIQVECKVVPDKLRARAFKGQHLTILSAPDHLLADHPGPPPVIRAVPVKDLPAAKSLVKQKRLFRTESQRSHQIISSPMICYPTL